MGKAKNNSAAFRETEFGQLIPAVRSLSAVSNFSLSTSSWTPVQIPTATNCKTVFVQTRNGEDWLIGGEDGAITYATIQVPISLNIAAGPGDVLFYAKASSVADTLEVLFWD